MGNKVIIENLKPRAGTDPTKFEYAISASKDIASVTKWYNFSEKTSVDEGKYYFFIRSIFDPAKVSVRPYTITCQDGATAICEITYNGLRKIRVNPSCELTYGGMNRITTGVSCNISYNGIKKISVNEPVVDKVTDTYTPPAATAIAMDSGKFHDLVPFANEGVSGHYATLETDKIEVGFSTETGLCLTVLKAKSDGINLINTNKIKNQQGVVVEDKGRSGQFASDYMFPRHAYKTPGGKNTADYGYDTGNNDVPGGSLGPFLAPGTILAAGFKTLPLRGRTFYGHVRPKIWGVPNEDSLHTFEFWAWVDKEILYYRVLHHKAAMPEDGQKRNRGVTQENPCLFLVGYLFRHMTCIGKPWTNAEPFQMNPNDFVPRTSPIYDRRLVTEGWCGAYTPNLEKGVTLATLDSNGAFTDSQVLERSGDADSDECTYIAATPLINYSTPGSYETYGCIIVGSLQRARELIYSMPRPWQTFNYDFSYDNQGWSNNDAEAPHTGSEMIVDLVEWRDYENRFYAGNRFVSPAGSWSGRLMQKIEVTMITKTVTEMSLYYETANQTGAQAAYQRKTFPVKSDGKLNTYVVDMSGMYSNDATICLFGIAGKLDVDNTGHYDGTEQARIKLIRAVSAN